MPISPPSGLTHKRLREVLDYDPATGEFIWLENGRGRFKRKGAQAGTLTADGRIQICIDRVLYTAGPIAFLWMTGRWPTKLVDHINLNTADNRWANLREADYSQNGANAQDRKGPVPLKGVTWHAGKYQAQIRVNYRNIYLGRFDTAEAAHAAYVAAAHKHFGEFARA